MSGVRFFVFCFTNGKLEGPVTTWFVGGGVAAVHNYAGGIPDGELILYFPNGHKFTESRSVDGRTHGEAHHFTPDGRMYRISIWENGVQTGRRDAEELTSEDRVAIDERAAWVEILKHYWSQTVSASVPVPRRQPAPPTQAGTPAGVCAFCNGARVIRQNCAACGGRGKTNCPACGGRGQNFVGVSPANVTGYVQCPSCFGNGQQNCFGCGGAGSTQTGCTHCANAGNGGAALDAARKDAQAEMRHYKLKKAGMYGAQGIIQVPRNVVQPIQ